MIKLELKVPKEILKRGTGIKEYVRQHIFNGGYVYRICSNCGTVAAGIDSNIDNAEFIDGCSCCFNAVSNI